MNSKTVLIVVIGVFTGVLLIAGVFSAGILTGQVLASNSIPSADTILNSLRPGSELVVNEVISYGDTPEDLDELFEPFWQAWDLVEDNYVDQPVDEEIMMRGAISGMLESLEDPHTSYLDPEMYERANASLSGEEYEGIGAWVDITGEYLVIISPMPDSPAEKAGLKTDDVVIAVDGEDMTGVDGEVVLNNILGPEDTTVTLTISRPGLEEPFDVEIMRAKIVVPTSRGEMLEDGRIAYIRLFNFGDNAVKDLKKEISTLTDENPEGMILDLRFNGGGYLNAAIDVVSQFIGEGVVMYEEYGDGRKVEYEAKRGGKATDIPLVVLINEGSASASEIVAGAIQDLDRGTLVGTTSFGKGSVQNYSMLTNDQGAVRVTIARWLTPDGRQIMGIGLEPDEVVEITEEDIEDGTDPQLEKAIELLLGK
jgi:carboxyl-terminal processing protease